MSTRTTKVFVHGNPEVAAIWSLLVAELEQRGVTDIVLLSPPGFGAPVPEGWAGDITAYRGLVDRRTGDASRRRQGSIDLVGHDWGAGHVFGAMAERPDLVRSFAADCVGMLDPGYVWHDMAQAWQTPERRRTGHRGNDRRAARRSHGDVRQLRCTRTTSPRQMAEAANADMGRCILTLYRSAAQPATAEFGRRLRAADRPPMLAIIASEDPYVSAAEGVQVADDFGAQQLALDGCGHWWMFEQPGLAADGLVAFWSSLD